MIEWIRRIAASPEWRMTATTLLSVFLAVASSAYVSAITTPAGLCWLSSFDKREFWLLVFVSIAWIATQIAFLDHDRDLLRFSDDGHCLAFIRKTHLEAHAAKIRKDPQGANLSDVGDLMKALKVKGGK